MYWCVMCVHNNHNPNTFEARSNDKYQAKTNCTLDNISNKKLDSKLLLFSYIVQTVNVQNYSALCRQDISSVLH